MIKPVSLAVFSIDDFLKNSLMSELRLLDKSLIQPSDNSKGFKSSDALFKCKARPQRDHNLCSPALTIYT
jgi:hypothetical protein